jgi:hypothetical protein
MLSNHLVAYDLFRPGQRPEKRAMGEDANPVTWCAVKLAAVALATALTIAPAVAVHDPSKPDYEYPQECCLDQDCAPVVSWSFVAADPDGLPAMVIETIHGTAIVPHDFPRRDSKDHRMHACLKLFDTNPATRLICFFVPPTT